VSDSTSTRPRQPGPIVHAGAPPACRGD
jgi:hypothetical protein